jgi:hypothetical protein
MIPTSAMAAIKARRLNMYPPEIDFGGDFVHSLQLWSVQQIKHAERGSADAS